MALGFRCWGLKASGVKPRRLLTAIQRFGKHSPQIWRNNVCRNVGKTPAVDVGYPLQPTLYSIVFVCKTSSTLLLKCYPFQWLLVKSLLVVRFGLSHLHNVLFHCSIKVGLTVLQLRCTFTTSLCYCELCSLYVINDVSVLLCATFHIRGTSQGKIRLWKYVHYFL